MNAEDAGPQQVTEGFEERYARLVATSPAVRTLCAAEAPLEAAGRCVGGPALRAGMMIGAAAVAAVASSSRTAPLRVAADAGADAGLFAAVNQDRVSNGVSPLAHNSTLQSVAEAWPYRCGGITVHGRAYDMIQRNYFSHVIAGCGQYVFSMVTAAGVGYRSAGENIGWSSGFGSASASVAYINNAFMNSPEHRANILNPNYTSLGVGSDWTPGPWTGAGGSLPNVSMFSEVFVQQGSAPPPPPPPPPRPPTPRPAGRPPAPSGGPPVNAAAPVAPAATTPAPTPAPTPTPVEVSPPIPPRQPLQPGVPPPLELQPNGLLSDSVESVLEGYLLD